MPARRRRWIRAATIAAALALGLAVPALVASIEVEPDEPGAVLPLGLTATTMTITIHDAAHAPVTSIQAGFKVHPRVVVSGGGAIAPEGQLTVRSYPTSNCTGTPVVSTLQDLVFGAAHVTNLARSLSVPGAISFQADYPGDRTYAFSTACKAVTITKATPTVTAAMHDAGHAGATSVIVGQPAHMFVQVDGALDNVSGTVTFNKYTTSDCSGTPVLLPSRTLDDGATEGPPITETTLVTRYVRARYAGNDIYAARNGPCLPISWVKADPQIQFTIHTVSHGGGATEIGTALHPNILVSGSNGTPTGTARVVEYPTDDCTTGGTIPIARNLALTNGATDSLANGITKAKPTTVSWRVTYLGDATYNRVDSSCRLARWRAPVTLTGEIHDSTHDSLRQVIVGTEVHASGHAEGSFGTPTGTFVPQSFTGDTCSSGADEGAAVALSGGDADLAKFTRSRNTFGRLSFRLIYSGDDTYLSAVGPCKVVEFERATPTIGLQVHDAGHATVTGVDDGEAVHPRVTFSGVNGIDPVGAVVVSLFSNGTCSGTASSTSDKATFTAGVIHLTGFAQSPDSPGSYSFRAAFALDNSYNQVSSPCSPFTILAPGATPPPPTATPRVTTAPTTGPTTAPTTPPGATSAPGASTGPVGSDVPAGSAAPGSSPAPGTSEVPGASGIPTGSGLPPGQSVAPAPSGAAAPGSSGPDATLPPGGVAGGAPGGFDLLILLVIVAGVVLGGAAFARRRAGRAGG